jgi:hypothetical protein
MKSKDVRALVREIIVDLDNTLAGDKRPEEDRHSAAASALILTARLLGGVAVNQARIAFALERIADNTEPEDEEDDDGEHGKEAR